MSDKAVGARYAVSYICFGCGVGVRRRSFDSGEIKRAADGGASIDCCCNYSAILAQSQMKLFRTELAADANAVLHLSLQHATTF